MTSRVQAISSQLDSYTPYIPDVRGFLLARVREAQSVEVTTRTVEVTTRLIFSPCLSNLPEKRTMSELFAGFSRHV